MEVRVWGVRGSIPAPGAAFARYGGNTACISVRQGEALVVLDGGTGLAGLGREAPAGRFDLLISHLHLDHLLGLPVFRPLYDPASELHFYGPPELPEALRRLMAPPYWPAALEDAPAKVYFHEVLPGRRFRLADGFGPEVAAFAGNHPGGSLLYRLEAEDAALFHALDCEVDEKTAPRLIEAAKNAKLLIWDAAFTEEDLRPGWGHSTWAQGCALAARASVETVLMSHFGADYDDIFLDSQAALARKVSPRCRFAKEGMHIWI